MGSTIPAAAAGPGSTEEGQGQGGWIWGAAAEGIREFPLECPLGCGRAGMVPWGGCFGVSPCSSQTGQLGMRWGLGKGLGKGAAESFGNVNPRTAGWVWVGRDLTLGCERREGAASHGSEPHPALPCPGALGMVIPALLGCLFSSGRALRLLRGEEQLEGSGRGVTEGENPTWNC